ncbi:MAG: pilus assembly PilX N-terminal domain-containing protein, partial [Gammaproteobacteria bacterium]
MKRVLRDERGMALAVAIFALVVVGAMIAGAFFAGTQEQRVGENQRRVHTSFGIAEAGVQERVLDWDPAQLNRRPQYPQDSVVIADRAAPSGTGRYNGHSYRLGPNVFLIDVTGQDSRSYGGSIAGGGGARQRVGLIARIAPIEFGIRA